MPFELGNQFGQGRPRRLDVEISRAHEAARHAQMLVEGLAMAVALDPANGEIREASSEAYARLDAVQQHLDVLTYLAAPLVASGRKRRRRRHGSGAPTIHYDQWSRDVATAAVLLDRLVGAEGPPQ